MDRELIYELYIKKIKKKKQRDRCLVFEVGVGLQKLSMQEEEEEAT